MPEADLVIRNADLVMTCDGPAPRKGRHQRDVGPIPGGAVAASAGIITFVGPTVDCDRGIQAATRARFIDAAGCTVLPGFVDSHTHVLFSGDRRLELQRRLQGETYADIAAAGGGILSTVAATRRATEDELVAETRLRLNEMLRCGTTTCEVKSGYGLNRDTELKMLRAVRRLGQEQPIDLVPTFLGAHVLPPEYRDRRAAYVDFLIREMIPTIAEERLAEWCDVFCDVGAFTAEEARIILDVGRSAGLLPRIHANELAPSGGAMVAAAVRARSADHLVFVTDEEIRVLASAGVVATLLPAAAFYLKLARQAPARRLIEAGVPVALATDVNPGGGFSPSVPFVMALACFLMDMTIEEALVASTLNAAYALARDEVVGSLKPGKRMDVVIIDGDLTNLLRPGTDPVRMVIQNGIVVHAREDPRSRPGQ